MGRCIVKTGFRFENPFLSRASISVTVLANAFKLFQFQHFISQMVEFTISFIFHTSLFPTTSMTFFVLFFLQRTQFFFPRIEWIARKCQESFGRSFLQSFTSISYVLQIVCSLLWHEKEGRMSGSRRNKAICECGKSKFHKNNRMKWK